MEISIYSLTTHGCRHSASSMTAPRAQARARARAQRQAQEGASTSTRTSPRRSPKRSTRTAQGGAQRTARGDQATTGQCLHNSRLLSIYKPCQRVTISRNVTIMLLHYTGIRSRTVVPVAFSCIRLFGVKPTPATPGADRRACGSLGWICPTADPMPAHRCRGR